MRLGTRGQYGVRAMVELAHGYGEGPVPLARLSERQGLPRAYLERLLRELKGKGLVASRRGAAGGYMLARRPELISVGQVIRALEGPLAPVACASEDAQDCHCERMKECTVKPVWVRLRQSMGAVLDATTLADLKE